MDDDLKRRAAEELEGWLAFDEVLKRERRQPGDRTMEELVERYGWTDETIRLRLSKSGFRCLKVLDDDGKVVRVWRKSDPP